MASVRELKSKATQRVVFKAAFDSPYSVWPIVEDSFAKELLARLLALASRVKSDSSKRKRKPDASFLVGLNEVTKGIESGTVKVVFACKEDVSPAMLFTHLPFLCSYRGVRLVGLPPGSAVELAETLNMKSAHIVGLAESNHNSDIFELLQSRVPAPMPASLSKYEPLQVKRIPIVSNPEKVAKRRKTPNK